MLSLISDFTDYYDHAFPPGGRPWERKFTPPEPRRERVHEFLARLGHTLPPRGSVVQVRSFLQEQHRWLRPARFAALSESVFEVVIYPPEGARVVTLGDAMKRDPHQYCTLFVPHEVRLRYVQVGKRKFWCEYRVETDEGQWKSTVNPRCCGVVAQGEPGYTPAIRQPLYAIDYLLGDQLYAIDFTSAPLLKGSGIEDHLAPQDVRDLLCAFHRDVPLAEDGS